MQHVGDFFLRLRNLASARTEAISHGWEALDGSVRRALRRSVAGRALGATQDRERSKRAVRT